MQGERLGNYLVTEQLGEGGMGTVYAAQDVLLGRPAAVKVLLPALSSDRDMIERLFNEARATAAIRHPGIVEIYDFGRDGGGRAYIAMELLPGQSLARRIARGRAPVADALHIGRQIAAALQAAHEAGIIHRDLKPDNVFVVSDAELGLRVKLLDFGIAKLAGGTLARRRTQIGTLLGTPTYMAPEQCRGVPVDHRADIYALGCILFELLTGRPPFEGEDMGDLLAAHIHMPPPAPSRLAPEVPPAIDALVLRLLEKDPDARPASARDVFIDLDLALAGAQKPPRTLPPGAPTVPMKAVAAKAASSRAASSSAVPSRAVAAARVPARRTGTGAPRSPWGWRGIGFGAGALALALGMGGVWLARGGAAEPRGGPLSAPQTSLTWMAPSVSGPTERVEPAAPAAPEPESLVAEPPTGEPSTGEPLGAEPPAPEAARGSRPGPGGGISSAR